VWKKEGKEESEGLGEIELEGLGEGARMDQESGTGGTSMISEISRYADITRSSFRS
jgi:hypothetical protein